MKFKCEKGSKDYYNEFVFVSTNYKKILNSPKMKVKNIVNQYILVLILSLVVLSFITYNIIIDNYSYFDVVILTIFSCIILLYGLMLLKIKNNIKLYLNSKGSTTIIIDEDGIKKSCDRDDILLKWCNVAYVIINKYSICFIPKELPSFLLGIPIEYKDKIVKGIEKYDKTSILIDNSGMY